MRDNYSLLKQNVERIAKQCGRGAEEITIVAASKKQQPESVQSLYESGCVDFGESRVQEALEKQAELPSANINWHFIGTLQKNKVRKIIGKFCLIHSVDTPDLAKKISECSEEMGQVSSILLQVNTSEEKSKHGLSPKEWIEYFQEVKSLPALNVQGFMTMAPLSNDESLVKDCFARLRHLRETLDKNLPHLSMGMSHDYPLAIAEGATLLRIGTLLFDGNMNHVLGQI